MGFIAGIGMAASAVSGVMGGIGQSGQMKAEARAERARGILAEEDSKRE